MTVRVLVYATEKYYSALLISGQHSKKIKGPLKQAGELENTLKTVIRALKMLKYPVEIELITEYSIFSNLQELGRPEFKNKSDVSENIDLWKELFQLIKQHRYFNHFLSNKNQQISRKFNVLKNDCLYKR
ncbi:hypothetical protein SAMN04488598_1653 [Halanaerobium congolense]|uniref:Uncharacterized protein n=1 Tax=Halanaerobium congolense TaxID=54121 RepID=A0A1I0D926_9FIRM|nr:hypothetical protein [Halanaerobium congolense]PTX14571.1 hypothetical protein C7953_2994 [Halanaerobium congolense]SDG22495.1 hypothetical protein SAMN04488598_1653 [Halanaerobium congolense]SET28450.1 hypothetical protein SAMN04515652_1653 [Halanaerobium congolense]SFP82243.1 hypothetical protein SAMN04488596_1761 [Halanaerobium congolense]